MPSWRCASLLPLYLQYIVYIYFTLELSFCWRLLDCNEWPMLTSSPPSQGHSAPVMCVAHNTADSVAVSGSQDGRLLLQHSLPYHQSHQGHTHGDQNRQAVIQRHPLHKDVLLASSLCSWYT